MTAVVYVYVMCKVCVRLTVNSSLIVILTFVIIESVSALSTGTSINYCSLQAGAKYFISKMIVI